MDINKKLILNMRDLNHIMRSLYEGKASQKRILIILNDVKSITQRDLTMRLGIQPGSASEILSKLENAGFILRTMRQTEGPPIFRLRIRASRRHWRQPGSEAGDMWKCFPVWQKAKRRNYWRYWRSLIQTGLSGME